MSETGAAIERVATHCLGVMCSECREVLVPDDCSCRQPHGYTYQRPSDWAARAWPNHSCFGTAAQEEASNGSR